MKAWLVVCAFVLPACSANANAPSTDDPQNVGKLSIDWTIGERRDPSLCASADVTSIQIDVTMDDGTAATSIMYPCTELHAATVLPPGKYMATAHGVDSTGAPRSAPIQTKYFWIEGSVSVKQAIDFPESSLFDAPSLD